MQVEIKMLHKQTRLSQTHKTHHDLDLEKNHHLLFHSMICEGYIKMTKTPRIPRRESQFVFYFIKLWISQLCTFITIAYKFWLNIFQMYSCNPWKWFFNVILHVNFGVIWPLFLEFLWIGIKLPIWHLTFLLAKRVFQCCNVHKSSQNWMYINY